MDLVVPRRALTAVAFAIAVAVSFGVSPAASLARQAAKKPKLADLVPTHAGIRGRDYAFVGKSFVTTTDRTKNQGSAGARRTHTDFILVHGSKRYLLTDRFVPALKPRESHGASTKSEHAINVPIGTYKVEVCVDVKNQVHESSEDNNCVTLPRPNHFFVIAQTWFGSLSGIKSLTGQASERWQSSNARFDFDLKQGEGVFAYTFSGTVNWTDSGTDQAGCVWSGSGTRTYTDDDSLGNLVVDYLHENYSSANLTDLGSQFFTTTISCPHGGVSTVESPSRPITFWSPSPGGTPISLPFGSRSLPGSASQMANVTWTWDLKAGFNR
jgi:CARDB